MTKFRHLEIKECNTPFDTSVKLEVNSGRAVAQLEYASVIGSLMYAMHCTRPDIAFAVSKLSQYTSNPSLEHWDAVSRVLGYLKRTSALQLTYTSYPGVLEGYSDASWINHSGDSKSTSGWIYTLAGGAVSWASKKQTCISHSTMEAEFIALAAAGKEAEWIRDLLMDIRLWPGDSKAALSIAYNSVYNGKSRHLRLRHNYVRQLVKNGTISVVYVKSCRNLADPLTKPLTRDLFSATTITLQTCDVATQGTKMVFVAALRFTAAAFWVVCLLSSWSTNVIFLVLVLFTDASLKYANSFATEIVRACYEQLNQGTALLNFRPARYVAIVAPIMILEDFIQQRYLDDGLSRFQSPTSIFKSSRNLTEDQVKSVMFDEHTQTLEETYDIYLLPPGADSETYESYLRISNREVRYSLMFEVVIAVIKRVPNRLHTELFVTDGICKVVRTYIVEVLAIIPQTKKSKLMEAYKNKIVPRKSEPSICVPPSIIC
ncbi:hypothetical protein Tco_0855379 [Tanacetum coccineum]